MSVTIQDMTPQAFETFYQWSLLHHTEELMQQRNLTREEARKESKKELSQMLPEGLQTENQQLYSIVAEGKIVGFLWTLHEETAGKKQSFLCDLAVWEDYRRRGYAAQALRLMEAQAAKDGCQESVLFVADSNYAARKLYEKAGYRELRQSDCGNYMIKDLRTDL